MPFCITSPASNQPPTSKYPKGKYSKGSHPKGKAPRDQAPKGTSQAVNKWILLLVVAVVNGCSVVRDIATPIQEPMAHYKVGNPYKISGVWYYPQADYEYDKVGIASWYGDKFHNKRTANGEIFDMNALTAAHKTLPLPSMVEVTNLENGRKIVLRVNDRGPFVGTRIIDLSRRAAQLLGFQKQGIAKVRVRILAEESMSIAAKLSPAVKPLRAKKATTELVEENSLEALPPLSASDMDSGASAMASGASAVSAGDLEAGIASSGATGALEGSAGALEAQTAQSASSGAPGASMGATEASKGEAKSASNALPPLASGGNKLLVQVGAFGDEQNARKLWQELKAQGFEKVQLAKDLGDTLTRVRIGPLADAAEAKAIIKRAINAGFVDSRVVVLSP